MLLEGLCAVRGEIVPNSASTSPALSSLDDEMLWVVCLTLATLEIAGWAVSLGNEMPAWAVGPTMASSEEDVMLSLVPNTDGIPATHTRISADGRQTTHTPANADGISATVPHKHGTPATPTAALRPEVMAADTGTTSTPNATQSLGATPIRHALESFTQNACQDRQAQTTLSCSPRSKPLPKRRESFRRTWS